MALRLPSIERALLSFAAACAYLSLLMFLLCAAGLATPLPMFCAFAAAVAAGWLSVPESPAAGSQRRGWWIFATCVALPFAILYFVNAAAPEISPDGSGYHLGIVRQY